MPVNWKDYPPDWNQIAFKKKEKVDNGQLELFEEEK